jgi:hypothetical protein
VPQRPVWITIKLAGQLSIDVVSISSDPAEKPKRDKAFTSPCILYNDGIPNRERQLFNIIKDNLKDDNKLITSVKSESKIHYESGTSDAEQRGIPQHDNSETTDHASSKQSPSLANRGLRTASLVSQAT